MEETKHTKGPWTANIASHTRESEPFGFSITAAGKAVPVTSAGVAIADKTMILGKDCRNHPWASEHYTPEEMVANAYLMGAAPELFEACREVLTAQQVGELSYRTSSGRGYGAMLAVEQAIKKATNT